AAGSLLLEGTSRTCAMIVRRDIARTLKFTVRGVSTRVPWTFGCAPLATSSAKSPLITSRVPIVTSAGAKEWIANARRGPGIASASAAEPRTAAPKLRVTNPFPVLPAYTVWCDGGTIPLVHRRAEIDQDPIEVVDPDQALARILEVQDQVDGDRHREREADHV